MIRTKHLFLNGLILGTALALSFFIVQAVLAQSDIQYPVAELGNCKNETECRTFCDKPASIEVCVSFAEKHNLMSKEEVDVAKKFVAAGAKGPGGCASKDSCETYCNDISRMDECLSFAEKNGMMPAEELAEAKKIQAALRQGAKMPGGCGSKAACESYCEDPGNMEECITFAEVAGFIPPDELAEAKQALQAIRQGIKPPACRGREACDAYCGEPSNFEECITFAEAAGFISQEEVSMARKTGGKGPGNCRGKAECESFCNNQANSEICFNFAKDHGLLSQEDEGRLAEGRQKIQEALSNAPEGVRTCLSNNLGAEQFEKLKAGTGMPSQSIGENIRTCFEGFFVNQGGDQGGFGPGGPYGQPGGGGGFGPPPGLEGGSGSGGFGGSSSGSGPSGPGGCKTPEECQSFCQANPESCAGSGGFEVRQNRNPGESGMNPYQGSENFGGGLPQGINLSPEFENLDHLPTPEELQQIQKQIFEQQYQQQTQQQYQQQYQEQYQSGGGSYPSPESSYPPPPSGSYDQYQQPSGSYTPPSEGSYSPPPEGNILKIFLSPFVQMFSN